MTGFRGQKFDFTGVDGKWYALFSSLPSMHVNMRGRLGSPTPSEAVFESWRGILV